MQLAKIISFFIILIFISSCATSSLKLAQGEKGWANDYPTDSKIKHSIYLIGDVGGAEMGKSTIPLVELKKHLVVDERDDEATDVVFLGDNIYPVGMPPIGHKDRKQAEHRLNVQLESVREFKGNVTFVPGNHDWYAFGREGLKRQEVYIEDFLTQYNEEFTDYFRPSDGCGDVDVMRIADKIALVSIDSHWFLTDKPRAEENYDFSNCEIQNRTQFVAAFADTLESLKDFDVMLTMHHPFYTTGKHGGWFQFSSYLMPLTEYKKQIKIPLPTSGVIVNEMRARISEQDTKSMRYSSYRHYLIPSIEKHGNTIVAAGHEHTLQYHVLNDVHYIVSGSGSKRGPLVREDYTKFAYGNYGYVLVDYYENGDIWMSFYANDEEDENFIEVYRSILK